jgi:hypothetical protein
MTIINFDVDYLTFSVGGNTDTSSYRGRTAIAGGQEITLDIVADNIDFLSRLSEDGDDIRWLVVTSRDAQIPHARRWRACAPLVEVDNISMGYKAAELGIETDNFEGQVDYVLINYFKMRRMVVMALFESENDAVLWKMRTPPAAAPIAA